MTDSAETYEITVRRTVVYETTLEVRVPEGSDHDEVVDTARALIPRLPLPKVDGWRMEGSTDRITGECPETGDEIEDQDQEPW